MKIVITGASGHLGINLVRALLKKGSRITALSHRNNTGLEHLDVDLTEGDVQDDSSLARAFRGADQVYHLAGYISLQNTDEAACCAINVDGTRNVVQSCLKAGVGRLVHVSSIHAFKQEPFDIPMDESRQLVDLKKAPAYDRSKAAGERIVRQAISEGLDAVIINPTAVIGPYDYRPSHIGQAILEMATGKLPALVNGGFDWVDARDVAEATIKAADISPSGSRFLLSGHWRSLKGLAELVSSVSGSKAPAFVCPMNIASLCAPLITLSANLTGTRPLYTAASLRAVTSNHEMRHDKASAELGYVPRPLEETIRDTVHWFRENGFLKES